MIPNYNSSPSKVVRPIPVVSSDDVLSYLRTKMSVPVQVDQIIKSAYDSSKLSNLTNLSAELLAEAENQAQQQAQQQAHADSNAAYNQEQENLGKDIDTGDTSEDGLFAMLFKIVPIGVNIATRGKTIATGFKESSMGLVDLIKNLAIITATFGIDVIDFFFQFFIYCFKMLRCTVTILSNFPKCIIFYIIDILMGFTFICIVSILFIIDFFLGIKIWVGMSCIEGFLMILQTIEEIDKMIYSAIQYHFTHYPDDILYACYICREMGDTSGFKSASSRMFNDIFVQIPTEIGEPLGELITGVGHIFSFLDLS